MTSVRSSRRLRDLLAGYRLVAFAVALSLLSGAISVAEDSPPEMLQITEGRIGFDGTIQKREFLPLSLKVQNLSSVPWTGTIQINRSPTKLDRIGAVIEQEISLQPEETRWVQVIVYVADEFEDWTVTWGPVEAQQYQITNLQVGPRPTVLVYDQDAVTPATGVLRRMPEELMPTSIGAMRGLRGIILSHAPFWQGARVQAVREWLQTGGRIYLLHDEQGRYPVFPKTLEFLNVEGATSQFKMGTIKRVPVSLEDLTLDQARNQIFNDDVNQRSNRGPSQLRSTFPAMNQYSSSWQPNQKLFSHLGEMAKFERRWWLIFLCVLLYLVALFPGCYKLGVGQKRVRAFYLVFFATVITFAAIFAGLSRLGAGATSRIRSAAIAYSLGDQRYAVSQWSYLAAARGGEYRLEHQTSRTAYSTCQEIEKVDGRFSYAQQEAVATFEMPPASIRELLHTGTLRTQASEPIITDVLGEGDRLERFAMSIDGCYEKEPFQAVAAYRGNLFQLKFQSGQLILDRSKPITPLLQLLAEDRTMYNPFWGWRGFRMAKDDEDLSRIARYRELMRLLVGNSYGFTTQINQTALAQTREAVRIFVQVTMPPEFFSQTTDFPDQEGSIVYVYDYPLDATIE